MKRISLILVAVLGLLLMQCSSSGNDDPNPTDDNGGGSVDKSGNLLGIGASNRDILTNENFDKILIEIAFVNGFRPNSTSIDNFRNFLALHTSKAVEDISIEYHQIDAQEGAELSFQEIADIESEVRQRYNDGRTLAIFINFTDATSENDEINEGLVTLGAVYRNTSMVIFQSRVRLLASSDPLITIVDAETATLNHEFGHLFGLVNLGTPLVNDHEDPDAENHCDVEGCLMRAELEFSAGMKKVLSSRASKGLAAVPQLGPECVRDLQNIRGL